MASARRALAMDRLLDACVGLGLLEKRGADYVNTPIADEYLERTSPQTLSGYIRYSNDALYRLWEHLDEAVIDGTNRWKQTFGGEGGLFTHFFRTPEAQRDFLMGMHGFGMISSPAVIAAFDLSRFAVVRRFGRRDRPPGARGAGAVSEHKSDAVRFARRDRNREGARGRPGNVNCR